MFSLTTNLSGLEGYPPLRSRLSLDKRNEGFLPTSFLVNQVSNDRELPQPRADLSDTSKENVFGQIRAQKHKQWNQSSVAIVL